MSWGSPLTFSWNLMHNIQLLQLGGGQHRWNSIAHPLIWFPFTSLRLPRVRGWRRTWITSMTPGWIMKGILPTAPLLQSMSGWGWRFYGQRTGSESFSPRTMWKKGLKLKEGSRTKNHAEKIGSKKPSFGGHQTKEGQSYMGMGFGSGEM